MQTIKSLLICSIPALAAFNIFLSTPAKSNQISKYGLSATNITYVAADGTKTFKAIVDLINYSDDTLKYLTYSCTPKYIFILDTKRLKVKLDSSGCNSEIPVELKLTPHQISKVELTLLKSNLPKRNVPIEYKIGIKLVNDDKDNIWAFLLGKNYNYSIIWSNQLKLTE